MPCIHAFEKLPEAASDEAKKWAVVFDFDTNSCYPAPAVSRDGKMNGGLKPSGSITGECRNKEQLDNSNTYYRARCITKSGVTYCVHMYALYFQKDDAVPGADIGEPLEHRHDWEFALVWTKNGELTHASYSAHGNVHTKNKSELHFDGGGGNTIKVVYHKDGGSTHAFRFAKENEQAENDLKRWLTPTLVEWPLMKSDREANWRLRFKFNDHNFGQANCPFNDKNFHNEIAKSPPDGYPSGEEWKARIVGPPDGSRPTPP